MSHFFLPLPISLATVFNSYAPSFALLRCLFLPWNPNYVLPGETFLWAFVSSILRYGPRPWPSLPSWPWLVSKSPSLAVSQVSGCQNRVLSLREQAKFTHQLDYINALHYQLTLTPFGYSCKVSPQILVAAAFSLAFGHPFVLFFLLNTLRDFQDPQRFTCLGLLILTIFLELVLLRFGDRLTLTSSLDLDEPLL